MKMFREELPETLDDNVKKAVTKANKTLANLLMGESIDEYSVEQINENIETLGEAKLGITDIDPEIWAFAQKVVQGQSIS